MAPAAERGFGRWIMFDDEYVEVDEEEWICCEFFFPLLDVGFGLCVVLR
jgi:hypothetical protein